MLKKFQNEYKKYTNPRTGVVFKIGDVVQGSGNVRGTIIALSANADFLLDTNDIIPSGRKIVHVVDTEKKPDPVPAKKTTTARSSKSKKPVSNDCESENQRLRRELDECNARTMPSIVINAPAEVQPKLPEYRQENLVQNLQTSANNIIAAAQSGDATAVRQEEKIISEAVKELKEVAPLQTVSVSENCRVIRSDLKGRSTIRIYFTDKPDDATQKGLLKHHFKPYFDVVNKKKDWYWGAYFTDERLKFATDFCGETKSVSKSVEKPVEKPVDKKYEQDEFVKKHIIIARPDTPNFVKPPVKKDSGKDHISYIAPPTGKKNMSPLLLEQSPLLSELIPTHQKEFLRELDAEGIREYRPIIAELAKQVADIKKSQDGKGDQAIVKAHYFYGNSDWYITEYNGHGSLFGFAILNGDHDFAELGYMSMQEFNEVGKVELDFYWTPKPLDEVLYKKSPSDYPKPKSMTESKQKQKATLPDELDAESRREADQMVTDLYFSSKPLDEILYDKKSSTDQLPTPDEDTDDNGDNELKELIAMMNKALKEKNG